MFIQGALENLMKAFLGFYVVCCLFGRADIPLKVVTELRTKAIQGTTASWGCPSVFSRHACTSYDPGRYK
jgi:hypothetical protein